MSERCPGIESPADLAAVSETWSARRGNHPGPPGPSQGSGVQSEIARVWVLHGKGWRVAQAKRPVRAAPTPSRRTAGKSDSKGSSSSLALRPAQDTEVVTDMQRAAGNKAVTTLLESNDHLSLQRVPVSAEFHETLYNKESGTGMATAPPRGFTGGSPTTVANPEKASYEMTRNADNSGVTLLIKIRFLQQARNTVPPPSPNPTGLPEVGQLTGSPSVIPVNDPSDRRTWAKDTASKATTLWNTRKISFASLDHPQPGGGRRIVRPSAVAYVDTATGHFQR